MGAQFRVRFDSSCRNMAKTTMKALVQRVYGGTELMGLEDVPTPVEKENEVLVEIYATNIAALDWRMNTLTFPNQCVALIMQMVLGCGGPRQPIRGITAAGKIIRRGAKCSTKFAVGDHVYFNNTPVFWEPCSRHHPLRVRGIMERCWRSARTR